MRIFKQKVQVQILDLLQFLFSATFVEFPLPAVEADHCVRHLPQSASAWPVQQPVQQRSFSTQGALQFTPPRDPFHPSNPLINSVLLYHA